MNRRMENTANPVSGDTANLETLLNSAVWLVGALVAPTCEPTDESTSDDTEVR